MLATFRRFSWISIGLLMTGCMLQDMDAGTGIEDNAVTSDTEDAVETSNNQAIPPPDEEGCHAIYAQDLLPTFELTIAPEVLAALYEDWIIGTERDKLNIDDTPYRPLKAFRYGDIVIENAYIRLRGNPTYWIEQNKLQFQVSFDKGNKSRRFLGLRKVLFDAATYNRHFLRDRLSLWMMRQLGITAPCANNARLFINGEYYGLFTSIEKLDEEFLARNFEDPTGDLWKRTNWELKTNLETATRTRVDVLRKAEEKTVAEVEAIIDAEQALLVYAIDAVIPNADGPWAGGFNYFFYDDPGRGKMVLLPWDLDNTFTRLDPDVDPYTFTKPERFRGRPVYEKLLEDDGWFALYIEYIRRIRNEVYTPAVLNPIITEWTDQIRSAVFEDRNKPFTNQRYIDRIRILREFIQARATYLDGWLACWDNGGIRDATGHCVP